MAKQIMPMANQLPLSHELYKSDGNSDIGTFAEKKSRGPFPWLASFFLLLFYPENPVIEEISPIHFLPETELTENK